MHYFISRSSLGTGINDRLAARGGENYGMYTFLKPRQYFQLTLATLQTIFILNFIKTRTTSRNYRNANPLVGDLVRQLRRQLYVGGKEKRVGLVLSSLAENRMGNRPRLIRGANRVDVSSRVRQGGLP